MNRGLPANRPETYVEAMMRALIVHGHVPPDPAFGRELPGDVDLERAMHEAGLRREQEFLWRIFMPHHAVELEPKLGVRAR